MKNNKNNGRQQSSDGRSNGEHQNGRNKPVPAAPVTHNGKKDSNPSIPPPGLRFPERSIEHQLQEGGKGKDKK